METTMIVEFGWMLAFAALAGLLSIRLKLPPVAGLLIAGMIVGPNILGLVAPGTIGGFAEIGAILLLFMIGIEFSVTKLLTTGLRAIFGSLILVLVTFTLMHEAAILLGLDGITSVYIASMFCMSSTAILMKILEQKGLVEKQEVHVLVTILIIEDVLAVFLLTFLTNLSASTYTAQGIAGALLVSLGILVFVYVVLLRILQEAAKEFLKNQSEDALILFSFALCIGMSILASVLGLTPAIGAFLAGSIIAALPNCADLERSLKPLSALFSAFFFLSIGMLISPATMLANAGLAAVIICSAMAVMCIASAFVFYLLSANGKAAIFAGLAMLPVGEFTLLIAKQGVGVTSIDLVGIASVGVLITSLVSSFAVTRSEYLYASLKPVLPARITKTLSDSAGYYMNVTSAFEPRGYFHNLLLKETKQLLGEIVFVMIAAATAYFASPQIRVPIEIFGLETTWDAVLIAAIGILSIRPVARILISVKKLVDALAMIFSRTTTQANKAVLFRNLAISAALFLLFANWYLVVAKLSLPGVFNWLSLLYGALSGFFFWSALRASTFWFFIQKQRTVQGLKQRIIASQGDMLIIGGRTKRSKKGKGKPRTSGGSSGMVGMNDGTATVGHGTGKVTEGMEITLPSGRKRRLIYLR